MNKDNDWDKEYTLTEEEKRKIELELALDELLSLGEERQRIDFKIKKCKEKIKELKV